MDALSVSDYRKNLAASFARADEGERVLIRRKNKLYALINIGKEELVITPEMQQRIDKARQEFREGKTLHFENAESVRKWMDEL